MAYGILFLRVIVGLILFGHGSQKLFGWFGGGGPRGTAGFFGQLGFRRHHLLPMARECPIRCVGMTETEERHVYEGQDRDRADR